MVCSKNTTYFLTDRGQIYFCGENYINDVGPKTCKPVEITCDTPFTDLISCGPSLTTCLAKTDQCVYELMRNELSFFETNSKTFDEYFVQNFHLTYKTMSCSQMADEPEDRDDIENYFIGNVISHDIT